MMDDVMTLAGLAAHAALAIASTALMAFAMCQRLFEALGGCLLLRDLLGREVCESLSEKFFKKHESTFWVLYKFESFVYGKNQFVLGVLFAVGWFACWGALTLIARLGFCVLMTTEPPTYEQAIYAGSISTVLIAGNCYLYLRRGIDCLVGDLMMRVELSSIYIELPVLQKKRGGIRWQRPIGG